MRKSFFRSLAYQSYKNTLFHNEKLNEAHEKDPHRAIALYVSIYLNFPLIALDPFMAGHMLVTMLSDPGREGAYLSSQIDQYWWQAWALWHLLQPSRDDLEEALLGST